MDMEWAKDGKSGELYIVQARPETVQSQRENQAGVIETYHIKSHSQILLRAVVSETKLEPARFA